jgi:hypothetical protein
MTVSPAALSPDFACPVMPYRLRHKVLVHVKLCEQVQDLISMQVGAVVPALVNCLASLLQP